MRRRHFCVEFACPAEARLTLALAEPIVRMVRTRLHAPIFRVPLRISHAAWMCPLGKSSPVPRVMADAGPRAAPTLRAIRDHGHVAGGRSLVTRFGPGLEWRRPADGAHRFIGAAGSDDRGVWRARFRCPGLASGSTRSSSRRRSASGGWGPSSARMTPGSTARSR